MTGTIMRIIAVADSGQLIYQSFNVQLRASAVGVVSSHQRCGHILISTGGCLPLFFPPIIAMVLREALVQSLLRGDGRGLTASIV